MKRRKTGDLLCVVSNVTIALVFIVSSAIFKSQVSAQQSQDAQAARNNQQQDWQARQAPPSWSTSPPSLQPPNPIASASYLSLDGLSLVIIFDKPVNLTNSIESVERRIASNGESLGGESSQQVSQVSRAPRASESATLASDSDDQSVAALANGSDFDQKQQLDSTGRRLFTCPDPRLSLPSPETTVLVQGIQICARLLTKKTLKLLHRYRLYNCIWPTQVQFIIQLAKSVPLSQNTANNNNNNNQNGAPIRVAFKRSSLSSSDGLSLNEREVSVELNRLPLEGLGVPLTPKLALTGPNQVPPCGQFSLSAHLSSPYGTQPGESIALSWSVERIGLISLAGNNSNANLTSTPISDEATEAKWRALQQLVVQNRGNNLVLDAQLLQLQPQVYLFHVTATYSTSVATVSLNATHQVGKIDFEAPIGTIYGSHLLGPQQAHQVNPAQEMLLLADVQVPECANNIKQVGVYWQVSDSRVKFEQTYAPFYLIKKNALPEQASVEFRLNLFYGIRVKKYASAGTLISTGDSILDASINDGTLVMSIGSSQQDLSKQLELWAAADSREGDKYTYQWSCFDGKTAQQCNRNSLASNLTRYEIGSILAPNLNRQQLQQQQQQGNSNDQPNESTARVPFGQPSSSTTTTTPLLDRQSQRQANLKLPLSWLEPEAQLWFGLQRFDRQQVASGQQPPQAKTEYALISLQQPALAGPTLSIGPVLIGRSRQRATIRNPLTGAIVLVAGVPVVVVGRLSPSQQVGSLAWHMQNGVQPLYWTVRNSTNPQSGEQELVSELHLNQNLLVAHAHHQIQLIACSRLTGAKSSASLSLDIVQSVSQCRVEVSRSPVGNSLVVSVEFCNLPLGLSPATYQIYVLDTSSSDGFMDANRAQGSNGSLEEQSMDEYANEADESFLEAQAEPLTVAQLSPVFVLNGISGALGLLATTSGQSTGGRQQPDTSGGRVRVRFGARVCDRIQSCKMFYSRPIGPEVLSGATTGSNQTFNNPSLALLQAPRNQQNRDELERSQSVAMQGMIDGAKRANMAGNSIAAISVLNGVITLASKTLQRQQQQAQTTGGASQRARQSGERLISASDTSGDSLLISKLHEDKLREFNQLAMRDCLHYTSLSLQRHFHYTDSGQTNLVTQTLAKILNSPQSGLEFKFRAMRLLGQVARRSVDQSLNLKQNCLADLRSLQSGYESIFGTFTQYSVADSAQKASHHNHKRHSTGANQQAAAFRSNLNTNINNNNNNNNNSSDKSAPSALTVAQDGSNPIGALSSLGSPNVSMSPLALAQQAHLLSSQGSATAAAAAATTTNSGNSRRKKEEAILAYLRYARQAYRSLVAAVAVQLPLGATHQLAHLAGGPPVSRSEPPTSGANGELEPRGEASSASVVTSPLHLVAAPTTTTTTTTTQRSHRATQRQQHHPQQQQQQVVAPLHFGLPSTVTGSRSAALLAARHQLASSATSTTQTTPTAQMLQAAASQQANAATNQQVAILSSLAHQTQLSPSEPIDVDLNEFGGVSILFLEQASLAAKLRSALERRQLKCRNDSATYTLSPAGSGGLGGKSSPAVGCSSFVLALSTFTGKAPFRSLDEGAKWLRVPVVELALLSPLDGSNLQDLMQSASGGGGDPPAGGANLQPADFKVAVTFTLPVQQSPPTSGGESSPEGDGSAASRRRLKCYKFSEELNEWQVSELQPDAEESLLSNGEPDSALLNGEQTMRRVKCSFNSLGVYGAFTGQPPPGESSAQLTIILGLVAIFGLVTVFSILGCFASSSRSSSSTRSANSNNNDDHYTGATTTNTSTSSANDLSTSTLSGHHHLTHPHDGNLRSTTAHAFGQYPL